MPSFITASGKHTYTFIKHDEPRPDYEGSVWHVHKGDKDIDNFVYWLRMVWHERFAKEPIELRYIVQHDYLEPNFEAVFYKKAEEKQTP